MKISKILFGGLLLTALVSCEENSTIGSSIIQDEIEIIMDSSFTVTGKSVVNSRIQSRTVTQLLGIIDAKGYGKLQSDIVTQFMPAGTIDTTDVSIDDIDSLKLVLYTNKGGYVGDSVVPMGLNVYPLTKQLPSPIYSDFNPADYYSKDNVIGSNVYAANALGETEKVADLSYRYVYVDLPVSLGRELFQKYKENPASYSTPSQFAQIFPGLYISNTYGSGRVMRIIGSEIKMYYHKTVTMSGTGRDSTYHKVGNYFAVTPEIITNNNISLTMSDDIMAMAQNGDAIVLAPAGMDVELTFPTREIISSYRANSGNLAVVNTLTFEIPAEEIVNDYKIAPPPYLLLVKSSEKDAFFAESKITDDKTSFYAVYDSNSKSYKFSSMRQYLLDMLNKGNVTDEDVTFTLTPVTIQTENYTSYYNSTVYINDIVPYVETPAMVKLNFDKAKINLTYSKQSGTF